MAKRKPVDAAKLFFYLSVGLMFAAIVLWILMIIQRDAMEADAAYRVVPQEYSNVYLRT